MREFKNLTALADHLDRVADRIPAAVRRELKVMGPKLREDAKAMFGHYQDDWSQLAPRTQRDRVRFGYSANDPLLRSGGLRDRVVFRMDGNDGAFVGVPAGVKVIDHAGRQADATEVMATQEWGSKDGRVPARPVFGRLDHRFHTYFEPFADGFIRRIGL